MKRAVVVTLLVALALPAAAAAHARLLRTVPGNGAAVGHGPAVVRIEFDDGVRTASGNAAVANATGASVLGGVPRAEGRALLLPLRAGLSNGAYSVRWSVVSDDGHREEGVVAFRVGLGGSLPHSILTASPGLGWVDFGLRSLYYLGLLAGAGAAAFGVAIRGFATERLQRPLAHLLFFSLLATFLGASAIVHAAPPGTRYALVLKVALTISLVGGAAAALAPAYPALLVLASSSALVLVAAPTLSGHAFDRNQPRGIAAVVDLAHSASAACWFGGLLALAFVVPAASEERERRALARRFSTIALVSVIVVALTGLGRALTELSAPGQVWSTSYGRALIVKTALFLPLVAVGWVSRSRLAGAFVRVRRSVLVEVVVLAAIAVVVGVLTDLRPGKVAVATTGHAVATVQGSSVRFPSAAAVVAARELGRFAVGVARLPGEATVTILGSDGNAEDGRDVHIDGSLARPCGAGCYWAAASVGPLHVRIDGRSFVLDLPATAPDGRAALGRITRSYRGSKTIAFDETLASTPTNAQSTRFVVVAPDRLSYSTRGGPAAVVIGTRRWDRENPHGPWLLSRQTRLRVTQPYWRSSRNVHFIAPGVLTFFDPTIPAWFRLQLSNRRLSQLEMTAAAHFMVDRYVGFNGPISVAPPLSR